MPPSISYFICTEPRTGGHFLAECLKRTGIAGNPEEYFWRDNEPGFKERWEASTYAEFLSRAFEEGSTPNGVFGAKVGRGGGAWEHFMSRLGELQGSAGKAVADFDGLNAIFPDLHYIFLIRRNKVRQAVSWWKAIQTGVWSSEQQSQRQEPEYKFEAIDHLVQEIVLREAGWQEYFMEAGITPLSLTYEEVVVEPEQATGAVLGFLGLSVPSEITSVDGRYKKMAGRSSSQPGKREGPSFDSAARPGLH